MSALKAAVLEATVQSINQVDAIAKGVGPNPCAADGTMVTPAGESLQRVMFRALWERINGAGAWDANPWVRVVEFPHLVGKEA